MRRLYLVIFTGVLTGAGFLSFIPLASANGCSSHSQSYFSSAFNPIISFAEKAINDFGFNVALATAPDPDSCGSDAGGDTCSGVSPSPVTISWNAAPNMVAGMAQYSYLITLNRLDSGGSVIATGRYAAPVSSNSLSVSPLQIQSNTSYTWKVDAYYGRDELTCFSGSLVDNGWGSMVCSDGSSPTPTIVYYSSASLGFTNQPNGSFNTANCVLPPTADIKARALSESILSDGPIAVLSGSSVVLSWTSTNTTDSCSISSVGPAQTSGSTQINNFTSSTVYNLRCVGLNGVYVGDSVSVNVLYSLNVSKAGTGFGIIRSSLPFSAPPGIDCGTDCTENYNSGTSVTLTATADSGSTFTGWSGGGCSGTGACAVTMDAVKTVTATFASANQPPVAVATISKDGSTYANSITVTRGVATPVYLSASGSSDPNGWTNATNGVSTDPGKCEWNSDLNQGSPTYENTVAHPASASTCNISLGSKTFNDAPGTYTYQVLRITDKPGAVSNVATVQVIVQAPSYLLTVIKAGTGSGSINSSPTGITCGADCTENYNSGTSVTLTATPSAGSVFSNWSGSIASFNPVVTVSMTQARNVTATFNLVSSGCVSSPSQNLVAGDNTIDFQTPHNYTNNFGCYSNIYTCPSGYNAKAYVKYITESNYDYFYIYNVANNAYSRWSGDSGGFVWKEQPNANQVKFRFTSDVSITKWGVDVDKINCYSTAPANQPPVAVATISKDGSTYANSITVTQGVAIPVYLSAGGSSDPNGWTNPTNGVSSGGYLEWNSDLNQGSPTFENKINNPPTPGTILLGSLTFNDAPGTYTYQVLRITDKPGAVSNVATVQVIVQAPSYLITVAKSGTGSGTVSSDTSGNVVTLTATPDSGSIFAGWSGDPDCSDGQVILDSNKSCTATFNIVPPPNFLLNNSNNINASLVKGQAGQSNATNLTVVPINGFSSNVDLSVQSASPSLPSGTTYSFDGNNVALGQVGDTLNSPYSSGSQFKVNIGPGLTSGGTYTIRVQGIDSGLLNNVDVILNVQIKQPGWIEF